MLDSLIRPRFDSALQKPSDLFLKAGMGANFLTLIGFGFKIFAGLAAALMLYPFALVVLVASCFFDGIAGTMARKMGITALGSYLNALCTFAGAGLFVFLFSLGLADSGIASAFVLLSFLVMGAAYLAHMAFLKRDDVTAPTGGLVEKSELALFMILCCLMPAFFPVYCALFGLLCLTTAGLRIRAAYQSL